MKKLNDGLNKFDINSKKDKEDAKKSSVFILSKNLKK